MSVAATQIGGEISVSAAARIAKCSPDTVLRWIEEGKVFAWRHSRRGWWIVNTASLRGYLERRQDEGSAGGEDKGNAENTANAARKPCRLP